jgi:hypothetical protein
LGVVHQQAGDLLQDKQQQQHACRSSGGRQLGRSARMCWGVVGRGSAQCALLPLWAGPRVMRAGVLHTQSMLAACPCLHCR